MSRPKKWTYPFESTKKAFTPPKEALGEYPFPVKRDDLVDGHDSTKQLGEVAAAADNLTDGNDFSLIDNPVESPDVKQISVEEAGPVGAQDSSRQVSTGSNEASASGPDFSLIDNPEEDPNMGLFSVKTANQAIKDAKKRPPLRYLFGQLWCEGDLSILCADTNVGKTILAMQIADAISSGRPATMGLAVNALPQKLAYFDFELSEMQFRKRYSDSNGNDYQFSPNLLRVEINPDADYPNGSSFEDFLKMSLEQLIVLHEVKIIIIDNITFLSNELEKANGALPLMKWLKAIGRKYGLSILILAHTPKRPASSPITFNDVAGSKMLSNFADSIFAIGVSAKDPKVRYIKELKQRNEEKRYDAANVIVCEIEKPSNFLQFVFRGYGVESDYLADTPKEELIKRVKELAAQGVPYRDIVTQTGASLGSVSNYVNKK